MAPKSSQQGQLGKGQRAISSFFKPKASPPSTATVAQSPCSEQAVPHSTAAAGVTQPLQDHALQSGNRLPESTPVSVNTERPTKRAKLSPAATPSQHSTVTIALDFDDDNTKPHNSSSDLPAPDATPGEQSTALPSNNSTPPSATIGAHSADTIPPRHAGRHMRFQHKLAKESSKESDGGEVPTQAFTPLELQIVELKKRHPGVLLVVEVGYKFRFFGDDAQVASQVCNIFAYQDRNFLTAGVPVYRMHVHVRRLVQAGHKVGIVRQTETKAIKAAQGRGTKTFQRQLTALYTASTLEAGDTMGLGSNEQGERATDAWSNERLSNWLVAVVEAPLAAGAPKPRGEVELAVVAVETSTGDVLYSQFKDGMMRSALEAQLLYAAPRELLLIQPLSDATQQMLDGFCSASAGVRSEGVKRDLHGPGGALAAVSAFYSEAGSGEVASGKALDAVVQLPGLVLQALAHALDYLRPFGLEAVLRLGATFRPFSAAQEMQLSPNALRQLEVLRNEEDGTERGSLLWLLDHSATAAGGRLLRSWVAHPLTDATAINERLDAVEELCTVQPEEPGRAGGPLAALAAALARLPDVERGITRILHCTAAPAEFVATMRALLGVGPALQLTAVGPDGELVLDASAAQSQLLRRLLRAAASVEVAAAARSMLAVLDAVAAEKNDKLQLFTCAERFPDVFTKAAALQEAKQELEDLLPGLRKLLRLPRLQFVTLANQGDYLVEVPAERRDVPKDWQKISSTKAVNRYRPPSVTHVLSVLELAQEHHAAACTAAWLSFLGEFQSLYLPFRNATRALAALDALQSLGGVARSTGYVRPIFVGSDEEPQVKLLGSRHPVLDAVSAGQVVPNDISLSGSGCRVQVITGPNMGGKSTVIRQVALIAIMAQVGSFVPADSATLHVVDAIHTRMGAQDNLALGRSTFLEELSEASAVLAAATPRSLVIIDELGRGTATHDGLAIALATLQALIEDNCCLTLFVTHYPQVAAMKAQFPVELGCSYMSYLQEGAMAGEVLHSDGSSAPERGSNPKITFLYRLTEGVADSSFGLNVARMAQLPNSVLERAADRAASMQANVASRQRHGTTAAQETANTAAELSKEEIAELLASAHHLRILCSKQHPDS